MPQDIKLWQIVDGTNLKGIEKSKLNLEERLEDWLEKDISIVSDDLLVIGRQVPVDFGGAIDLLCLDSGGAVVVVELKRDKTPREITAQTLDYASWVSDLSYERIPEIANSYLKDTGPLEAAFQRRFRQDLPETLDEQHKMLIVASEMDSASERIVRYLSASYGVPINAVTFNYFRDDSGREFLARVFLIEERVKPPRGGRTLKELQDMADRQGVGGLYKALVDGLTDCFDRRSPAKNSIGVMS